MYEKLTDLLAEKNWREADEETYLIMIKTVGKEAGEWLYIEDIDNLPSETLLTIDQLWLEYSQGQFGFSVQQEIYHNLGGTREYNAVIWQEFGKIVGWYGDRIEFEEEEQGWLQYHELIFNPSLIPKGHLPVGGKGGWVCGIKGDWGNARGYFILGIAAIASRLVL
ncbi:GUN4 domain protein [Rippkaea orientalis PCC 8801]|uniref:GUN4 domain protein n=1 Tax=Rippkaea orientalis (strain PCC 8801 / RF-1) TaxID=41431 RepID=B7JXM9_RIPO1|nr:GUN4 domain-containing protein [Rippkaea orientalis]ACK64786.1 GUN4 domain protein [Rippkaea orientalis PCC 8801]